jgi:hypothetical protein
MSTREIQDEIKIMSYLIFDIDCPILDIGEEVGVTGYIDFINPERFSESVRKGTDKYGRKFITFRANIEYNDGEIIKTFTTFFQRYAREELLWMCAGKQTQLFSTEGGSNLLQMKLLLKLLRDYNVDVTEDMIQNCRLVKTGLMASKNKPVRITLQTGNVSETKKPTENVQDVMRDLEYKVNPKSVTEAFKTLATSITANDPSIILAPMEAGAKEFQERVGRPMTYSEMRMMWG